jgi:hypothetical protein
MGYRPGASGAEIIGPNYAQLDEETRRLMLDEIQRDERDGKLYISPRLSQIGVADYPQLLRRAAESGTDDSLAASLKQNGRLNPQSNGQNLVEAIQSLTYL